MVRGFGPGGPQSPAGGEHLKEFGPGVRGSLVIFFARFRVLEVNWSCSTGRLQPITFSAEQMIQCSLLRSFAGAAASQMEMEEVKIDSMTEV